MFFSRPPAAYRVFFLARIYMYVRLSPVCVRSRACASVRLNPIIRPRPSSYVHVRLRPCPYVCVRACTSASVPICLRLCPCVCIRACVCVCVHIIKSPDASARIISDASGRVFRSKTFEVYYIQYIHVCTCTHVCILARTRKRERGN